MTLPIPDLEARARALDAERSFIVQAPAGSGKTELLIQRYLALLARVERPEEIAALTFTRKAAAEMRHRILEALHAARHAPRPEEPHHARTWELARAALARDEAHGWGLEHTLARLRVQTIDALCASLTRQMPVVSQLGSQPESVDDATALYEEAARNTLALLDDDREPQAAADVERLLGHLDFDAAKAAELLIGMLRCRDHWIRALAGADERSALEAALGCVREEAVRRAGALFPPGAGVSLPPEHDVEAWQALAAELLTATDGAWRKRHALAQSLAGEEPLRKALLAVRALPPARYADGQWAALGAITRLLPRAMAELKLVFAARGQVDFVEVAQAALRALGADGEPSDLLLALDYRIRHILVDEFQDTSFTQRDLLRTLTAGWEPGDGRTLFLVGDPMQSIYRFREAEVALFLEARHDGIGAVELEPLTLSANFRSQEGVVSWVNDAFARVMPREEDIGAGAVPYSPSQAVHPALPEAVTVHAFDERDTAGEAGAVARLAAEALSEPQATVAVLVRNRNHLAAILPAMRAAGLPYRAVDIEPLGHRPVVQDLHALMRALTHLADRTAWLAVLRAPWCGLRLADLEALARAAEPDTLWDGLSRPAVREALSADGRERVERLREAVERFVERRGRTGLRNLVEGAWLALGGPACVPAATDFRDAAIYLDHLEAAEVAGAIADPAAFEREVAGLYAQPDAGADRLQVMTIHKAKGLEFDTVIVPGLGSGSGRDDRPLFLWMETTAGLLLAPIAAAGEERDPTYEFIRGLDRAKADHECGRLLYVAATRARRRLHLMGACRRGEGGQAKPASGSLLAKLWPAVAAHFESTLPQSGGLPQSPGDPATPADGLSAIGSGMHVRLSRPVFARVPEAVACSPAAPAAPPRDAIEFSWAGRTARQVGTVVHRWLQRIAEDEMRGWSARRVASLGPAIREALAARGVPAPELAAASERALAALVASIGDERGRWLLGPHGGARNEYRLTAREGAQRRNLVIDRMFVDAEGRTWIVDYKTSAHEGADLERFLDEEQRRYRPQLAAYAAAALGSAEGMLGLYFPLLRGWRAWPAREASADAGAEALTP